MAKSLIQDIIIIKKQAVLLPKKNQPPDKGDESDKKDKKEEKPRKRIFRTLFCFRLPRVPGIAFHRSNRKLKWTIAIITILVLVAGSFIVLKNFSSVTVEITPRQQFVDIDVVFQASIEPKKDELPLEMMQISREEKDTYKFTGVKQVSKKSSGQAVLYNSYSSQPQTLIKDTRLETPDGKIYRLPKTIVVPGAKVEGGKVTTSEIETTVFADKPGEEYNIGLTDFTLPGFKDPEKREKIYGRSKTEMKGGFIGEIAIIAEKDIKAIEDIRISMKEKVNDYLLKMGANPKPESFLLYENAKQIVFDEQKNKPKVGDEGNQIDLKESAVFFGFLLKKSDVNRALGEKYLGKDAAPQIEILNLDKLDFELKNFTATAITFSLKDQAHFSWKIDEDGIKADLIKESQNPQNVFPKYPAIEKAKIIFKPSWWKNVPKDAAQIIIKKILKDSPLGNLETNHYFNLAGIRLLTV